MADDIQLSAKVGDGATIATDDDGSRHWQYLKVAFGPDNTQNIVGSISSNPLPVALSAVDNAVLDTINTAVVATQAAVEIIDNAISGAGFNTTQLGGVNIAMNTGARSTGTQRVTIATDDVVPVTNAGLTELAAAINSSRVDVNIAASGVTLTVAAHAVTNAGVFPVQIVDPSFAVADGNALGEGVLIQGDDGTDRKNINVNATTGDIQVDITHTVTVDGSGVTQPISAVSLPLPTSAATSANQLADGHNVTIDNSTGGAAVNIQDGGNTITVDGTITANAGTNLNTSALATEVTLGTIDADTGNIATSLALIDNSIYTHDVVGPAVGMLMMARRDDEVGNAGTTDNDGDASVLTANKFGQLKTTEIADATSEIKYKAINVAASGDRELVPLVSSTKIRVLSVLLIAGGTTTARFESNAGGTALSGVIPLVANSGFSLPFNPGGWFESASGQSIHLEVGGADIDGMLSYVEV